jgi:cell wall-associated NlpC family hydrolase
MRKRQIFVLSGFFVLCLSLISVSTALAKQYEVKKGDNLHSISKKMGVSIQDIQKANDIKGTALKLKQVLYIPEKGTPVTAVRSKSKTAIKTKPTAYYTVRKGDNLALIAKKTGVPLRQITAINKINPRNLRIGQKLALAKAFSPPEQDIAADEETLLDDNNDEGTAGTTEVADLEKDNLNNAELLGKWSSSDERKLFVKVATGFLGAPYRLGGSTVRGIDCSAFVRKIYHFFDITLPRTAREQSNVGLNIDKAELVEGDLVFFSTRREFGHVGIYIGNHEFVHASSRDKVVRIDSLDTPYFHKRFVRAVRVKGLDDNGV